MGVADQLGIDSNGEFVSKLRITHDLSFPGAVSGESINSRIREGELEPCMFGHTLLRVIHRIVNLRKQYPNTIIWIRKEDFKSVYCRIHVNAKTAIKAAVKIIIDSDSYVLLSLRLPFGDASCPSDFGVFSDIITDTINDLMACEEWDPTQIHSSFVEKIQQARH